MCSLQVTKHASTKWLTVAPPYIPDAVVPTPHLGFVQVTGSQSPSIGQKSWGMGKGMQFGGQWSCTGIGKKKQGPFKHASHLRWRLEAFLSNLRG
jgi:hypothetical protein